MLQVPPIFPSSRNALYTRFSLNDWNAANVVNYVASDKARSSAERVRLDGARLCREANDKTTRTQNDVGRRLGDRIGDIDYWKTEVRNEIDQMITEIDALTRAKAALEKMIVDLAVPLHIAQECAGMTGNSSTDHVAQECLYNREKRQGIDLVHDDVERALLKASLMLSYYERNALERTRRIISSELGCYSYL